MKTQRHPWRWGPAMGIAMALVILSSSCRKAPVENQEMQSDARAMQDFSRRIDGYLNMHHKAEAGIPHLKAEKSGTKITQRQRALAVKVRQARRGAKQGDIFTPEISAYFNRSIKAAYQANGERIQASFETTQLDKQKLEVNAPYPEHLPYTMMPPSILLRLPKLPTELEYRFVGKDLILRDRDCNLVVDIMPNAIPQ